MPNYQYTENSDMMDPISLNQDDTNKISTEKAGQSSKQNVPQNNDQTGEQTLTESFVHGTSHFSPIKQRGEPTDLAINVKTVAAFGVLADRQNGHKVIKMRQQ